MHCVVSQARKRRSRAASSSGRGKDAAPSVVPAGAKKHASNAWNAAAASKAPPGPASASAAAGATAKRAAAVIEAQAGRTKTLALWVAAGVFAGWLLSGGWRSVALRLPQVRRDSASHARAAPLLTLLWCNFESVSAPSVTAASKGGRRSASAAQADNAAHFRQRRRRTRRGRSSRKVRTRESARSAYYSTSLELMLWLVPHGDSRSRPAGSRSRRPRSSR